MKAIIADKKGRLKAKELQIEIIGSLGVLLKAKHKGVIKDVSSILDLIDKTNFRLADKVRKELLSEAGELPT